MQHIGQQFSVHYNGGKRDKEYSIEQTDVNIFTNHKVLGESKLLYILMSWQAC